MSEVSDLDLMDEAIFVIDRYGVDTLKAIITEVED